MSQIIDIKLKKIEKCMSILHMVEEVLYILCSSFFLLFIIISLQNRDMKSVSTYPSMRILFWICLIGVILDYSAIRYVLNLLDNLKRITAIKEN